MELGNSLVAIEALKTIKKNPRLTPQEIAEKISASTQYTRNTLKVLAELQLVRIPVRGVYLITELGEYVLNQIEQKT